jgi:Na+-transporting NADH:ubiquinone oxidoreductase subunit NqrB
LLKPNGFETALFACFMAIGRKFIIRYNGKHVFKPNNIGLIATIILTQDAWISPGQWVSHLLDSLLKADNLNGNYQN